MENYNVTKEMLLRTEIPLESRTYKPVIYRELIDLTLNGIEKAGFQLESESYTAASKGLIATGKYTISNVADSEMKLQLGWLNSYNKVRSVGFAIGAKVIVCTNNMVSGNFGSFRKKHTGSIQEFTPKTIEEYIKRSADAFEKIQYERDVMKEIEVSKRTSAELIGRMFIEEEIITSTQLNIINREIQLPSFDYKCDGSLYQLYQHVTHSLKETHPTNWMSSHINAHKFFINESGILLDNYTEELNKQFNKEIAVEESMFKQLELWEN